MTSSKIKKSPTLAINEEVNRLRNAGKKIFSFGLGQSPFPIPDEIVDELSDNAFQKDYLQVQGLKPLREAVSFFHSSKEGIRLKADNILIGPGSKELIFQLMLCFEGEIILVTPCWVTYHPQALVLNKKTHFIHTRFTEGWKLQSDQLHNVCIQNPKAPKLLILNYPSNPCGNGYTKKEIVELAKVARANNVLVLSDEIYGQLNYQGDHYSIAHEYPEGTIVSAGLSKWCGAGGWRLGTFAFSEERHELLNEMISIASETFTAVSAPIQYAAIKAFTGSDTIEAYLIRSREILLCLAKWIYQRFTEVGIQVYLPEGGFYVFPDFENYRDRLKIRGVKTSQQFCMVLLDEIGFAALTGSAFGRSEGELTIRLSFVSFDGKKALEAPIDLIQKEPTLFIEQYCFEVYNGITQLLAWLEKLPDERPK